MASGIYKSTMRRAHSGTPKSLTTSYATLPPGTTEKQRAPDPNINKQGSAQPLINHTMYVDRQVARHARSRSKRKQIRNLKIAVGLLIVGLIVATMGWIYAWAKLQKEQRQSVAIDTKLHKSQRLLEETQSSLKKREGELAAMLANRLPGLSTIEYNKLVDIDDQYVHNIAFSEAGVEEAKTLEYHAMLVNADTQMVLPRVKIFFFDELGLQVGTVELKKEDATGDVPLAEMEPGETRSYHSSIRIERGATPKYYIVHVE